MYFLNNWRTSFCCVLMGILDLDTLESTDDGKTFLTVVITNLIAQANDELLFLSILLKKTGVVFFFFMDVPTGIQNLPFSGSLIKCSCYILVVYVSS